MPERVTAANATTMKLINKKMLIAAAMTILLVGCTTWGSKMTMGDQHYASVRTDHVFILFEKPTRPYVEIGLVSSLGGWFASDGDNYHKMQMAAAALGADAVIVRGQDSQAQGTIGSILKPAELRSSIRTSAAEKEKPPSLPN
jgi:hypothetical protein